MVLPLFDRPNPKRFDGGHLPSMPPFTKPELEAYFLFFHFIFCDRIKESFIGATAPLKWTLFPSECSNKIYFNCGLSS